MRVTIGEFKGKVWSSRLQVDTRDSKTGGAVITSGCSHCLNHTTAIYDPKKKNLDAVCSGSCGRQIFFVDDILPGESIGTLVAKREDASRGSSEALELLSIIERATRYTSTEDIKENPGKFRDFFSFVFGALEAYEALSHKKES